MNYSRPVQLGVASLLACPLFAAAQPPAHQHYQKPPAYEQVQSPGMPLAPRLQNLGVHTFKVTTTSERAQLFINQGMNLAYGFNHAEAARAFAEAARLDPSCAMAYWGQALVLGPNINAQMNAEDEPKAFALVQKAVEHKATATEREQDYIDALLKRYTGNAADRQSADRAFAHAMSELVSDYPDDLDARTIYAESLMDLRPWNYWMRDGQPYEETQEIQKSLEQVLAKNPNHPGALHYWIHLWEPTDTPERAEAEADRLLPLMPGAGHVVHMPAHIYMRVGRHADVVRSNQLAVLADEDYIAQCRAQGVYPLGYYPHNIHFIWMGATAGGQRKLALEAARKVAAAIPNEALATVPVLQSFLVVPYWTMVRFGQWNDILAEKGPAPRHAVHARCMALRTRDGADRQRATPGSGCRTQTAANPRERSVAQGAGHFLDEHRVRDPPDRSGGRRRRDRGPAEELGRCPPPSRTRRAVRGQPHLPGALGLACAGAAEPRRRPARRRPRRRGRGGVLGGPAQEPGHRLGALRVDAGPEGARKA